MSKIAAKERKTKTPADKKKTSETETDEESQEEHMTHVGITQKVMSQGHGGLNKKY